MLFYVRLVDNDIALVDVTLFCVTLKTTGRKRVKANSRLVFVLLFISLFVFGSKGMLDFERVFLNSLLTVFKGSSTSRHSGSHFQGKSIHEVYDGVKTLLIFIGYPRSGHTLVSSLLDAHPHVIVANEFDVIGKWDELTAGNRNKYYLFDQLYLNSKEKADVGDRSATTQRGYSYHVPGQWQGTYNRSIMV